ncbi:Transcriptional regulator of pyrimidine catabolism (TetR family) [hydrothermal vent metagenome]|uniref:Transcriptional regulator of pyrimidine catabolism (TetR family) n=1 Tax=hydrothermal vent metagenome TaxID=652676 RepID=A0A3B0R8L4_9ZZZZ
MTDTKQSKIQSKIQRKNRQKIMDAALEVFSTYGFRGSTIEQIAKAAEMSKSSVFYYFSSKTEIYVELLSETLQEWLEPLTQLDPKGDPALEIWAYVERKIDLSRLRPRESRLFANEILHGAPNIMDILTGELKDLIDEKCAVIQTWIDQGRLASVSPYHLIFMIWGSTQHYADFEVQVGTLVGDDRDQCFVDAHQTLKTIFLNGLNPLQNQH